MVKWELSAEKAVFPKGNKEILLKSLGLKIRHNPEVYLTSGSGIYNIDEGNIELDKPVELNIKDSIFRTSGMKWNIRKETLATDSDIEFSGENFHITGRGLTAKTKEQKVRILNNVKAVFYL